MTPTRTPKRQQTWTGGSLRVGDTVEVRSPAEIRATLDARGELEELPFMPEMLAFCGKRLSVHKVAHKVCDTISRSGMRRMTGAVYLSGARCDGAEHGGCQTACQFLWKEQWLKPVSANDPASSAPSDADRRDLLALVTANARKPPGLDGTERYSCQATELLRAAPVRLPFLELRQYVADVRTGNVSTPSMIRAFLVGLFNRLQRQTVKFLPERLRFRGGLRWGFLKGGVSGRTPTQELDLQPGELVRVKSKEEILATLDADLLNRGMGFDEEMSRYCGRVARVQSRVQRCIDESTGAMLTMKYPCIVLENIVCAGAFNVSCPREFIPFWREIWLERVDAASDAAASTAEAVSARTS
jgi:hypothetical protein